MKYEHNEVFGETVGEIVQGGYRCNENEVECQSCPFNDLSWKECSHGNGEKRQRVIEYIAEEVAESFKKHEWRREIYDWKNVLSEDGIKFYGKYPVDEQAAKEIADAARVLLEEGKKIDDVLLDAVKFSAARSSREAWQLENLQLKEDRPTTADAFYVYNADLVKCATVSHEQGDDIIDIFIDNEVDVATAKVFCEKLSTFLRGM